MRVVAIMVVQDEADVIAAVVTDALVHCDSVLMYDTGSVDGSREIMEAMAHENERIKLIHSIPVHFHEFETRRHALWLADRFLTDGDWVLWLDGDEFLGASPRRFVQEFCMRADFVRHRHYNFAPSARQIKEKASLYQGRCFDRRNYVYYREYAYVEVKMFRFRKGCRSSFVGRQPRWLGRGCPFRLPILHYPYRSLPQIRLRLALRELAKDSFPGERWGGHWSRTKTQSAILEEESPGVLKFTERTVAVDLRRKDGLYDSRVSGLRRMRVRAKQLLARALSQTFGVKSFDWLFETISSRPPPRVLAKDCCWMEKYRTAVSDIQRASCN